MADDLADLGTTEIFPIEINWADKVTPDIGLVRAIQQYKGTATLMEDYVDIPPEMADFGITLFDHNEIYTFLDFFNRIKGRAYKFWLKLPWRAFTLKYNILSGSTAIPVYRNQLQQVIENDERIWIGMHSDDIITRKVLSVTDDISGEKHTLNISTPTDRALTTDNHNIIARLLLCRFVSDSLKVSFHSEQVLSIRCKVIETVKEYGEA